MSQRTEITAQPATVVPVLASDLTAPEVREPPNLLKQVHALLRGRYWLAITLAALGAVGGALIGHNLKDLEYESTGLIRVEPYLPRILYEDDQNGIMPMYDAFVATQVELIKSQRVVDLAMQDPDWAALGRGLAPAQVVAFRGSLEVTRPKGTPLIVVAFRDRDPEAARIAVESVISAYERLEAGTDETAQRIEILERRRTALANELKAINDSIFQIANELGSGALETIYEFKLSELNKLESELRRAELDLAVARGAANDATEAAGSVRASSYAPDSPEALAMRVPEIRQLLDSRRSLERQLRVDRERLGPTHARITGLESQLAVIDEQLDEAVQIYKSFGFAEGSPVGDGGLTLAQLEARERNVRTLFEQAQAETQDLGRKTVQVESLRSQANEKKTLLEETRRRLEAITLEQNIGGRIFIESTGDRPLAPAEDKRRQFAAAGAMGLGGAGVGLILLLGLIDRRIRGISDMEAGVAHSRLLGVLPHLPDERADPEQALTAAHAVHQIRTSLHGRHRADARQVFTVTSPSPGSGKTSLTLALGLSFAASRSRTLLIDCDFIGGGLTSKMKKITRRRLGHILRREGVITTAQLVEALKARARDQELLGETLVRIGHATQQEVDAALETQRQSLVGLREAMLGDPPQECFTETGTRGLYLMPLGTAARQHIGELSYPALLSVIEQLRRWFDVIIIDTGPILGSLEASVAALVADEVVLTVARGEDRAKVQRSLEQLSNCGATLAGVVLNRANMPDVMASGFSSSMSRRADEQEPHLPEHLPIVDHKSLRLGPIGSAVAALSAFTGRDRDL